MSDTWEELTPESPFACRFVSRSGLAVTARVSARDPESAFRKFFVRYAADLDVGRIEVLDEDGTLRFDRDWPPEQPPAQH